MKQPLVKNSEMMKYANEWVDWYQSDRKRTAELFRNTLLKMDEQKVFNLEEYNLLVDQSNEREETRLDAKKMARVLARSWVWNANAQDLKKFNDRANTHREDRPIKAGKRIVRACKNDGVRF